MIFFKVGISEPKLLVTFLQSGKQKRLILKNQKFLKDYQTIQGKKMYINDYTPAAHQEKKFRENQILHANEKAEDPLKVTRKKGKLFLQNQQYLRKVNTPTPKDIVDTDPQQLTKILEMRLQQEGKIIKEGSIFEGYTASVSSHAEIRSLYIKAKLMKPGARHIVCAFMLPGKEEHFLQDFCDDEEHGAGRILLDYLKQNSLQNRVVFVARKYGGIRMGPDRFECYKQAAELAIKANLWNHVTKEKQVISISATALVSKPCRQPPPKKKDEKTEAGQSALDRSTSYKRPANSPAEHNHNWKRPQQQHQFSSNSCNGSSPYKTNRGGRSYGGKGARGSWQDRTTHGNRYEDWDSANELYDGVE